MIPTATAAVGAAALAFAALALIQRTLYASAMCLLVVLLQVAALFYLFGSPALAFLQVLVYAGAIMVLLVIASMSSAAAIEKPWARLRAPAWLVAFSLAVPAAEVAYFLVRSQGSAASFAPPADLDAAMGRLLFGPMAGLTELVGVLVLVAALAVVPEAE